MFFRFSRSHLPQPRDHARVNGESEPWHRTPGRLRTPPQASLSVFPLQGLTPCPWMRHFVDGDEVAGSGNFLHKHVQYLTFH